MKRSGGEIGSGARESPGRSGQSAVMVATVACLLAVGQVSPRDEPSGWPAVEPTHRPWAYWWWMGSAVNEEDLRELLTLYRAADLGGLHVIPIYGVKGEEKRFVNFLSPRWLELFCFTVEESRRLGLEVDLTCGTGWPFGGPHVPRELSAQRFEIVSLKRNQLRDLVQGVCNNLVIVVGRSPEGRVQVIEEKELEEQETGGDRWKYFALLRRYLLQRVERAAPGGEGLVLDFFSAESLHHYLHRFDESFSSFPQCYPRAWYNDSFEVPEANWTPRFLEEFFARRGYDLRTVLPLLAGEGDSDSVARVKSDFRETLADLLLERFVLPWTEWAHRHGTLTRNQAHGMPGNLLDLYAAADIPETEQFGSSLYEVPGVQPDPDYPRSRFGTPETAMYRFASSAAHLAGRRFVSAETGTWLGEHFRVSLAQLKLELDRLWLAGVNHVFYHGIAYSPPNEEWPGWLYYASSNLGPTNSYWEDLKTLNRYVTRVQGFLQAGLPDGDLLLYFPIHDAIWHDPRGLQKPLTVHNTADWLHGTTFYRLASALEAQGFLFDYISDRQIQGLEYSNGFLRAGGNQWKVLIVPAIERIPLATMRALQRLAKAGATILFEKHLPTDVPGFGRLAERRRELGVLLSEIAWEYPGARGVTSARVGQGRWIVANSAEALGRMSGVCREPAAEHRLGFVRRRLIDGRTYFLANLTAKPFNGWLALCSPAKAAAILDPLSGRSGLAALRQAENGRVEIFLQLRPGESAILRTWEREVPAGRRWRYYREATGGRKLEGHWEVRFLKGGPQFPPSLVSTWLDYWTRLAPELTECFSGSASYSIEFSWDGSPGVYLLRFDQVRHSARVFLNGNLLGTLIGPPLELLIESGLRKGQNRLDIVVTNLTANRIRCMDRNKIPWKRFYDINFVNILYEPFDASSWPVMEAGLAGSVQLVPLEEFCP